MICNPAHPGEVLRDYLGEMSVFGSGRASGHHEGAPVPDSERACRNFSVDVAETFGGAWHVA